ncbi:MAG: class GN sortase [Gammaproteobacteria bacterium]
MKKSRLYYMLLALTLVVGGWQVGQGVYIYAKAQLAQYLMLSAWEKSRQTGRPVKPWPWADTWPVARLRVPSMNVDLIVLAGDTGRTLAFGPGYRLGTVRPGETGNSVISAHRDTHFHFLKRLRIGDELFIENQRGEKKRFVVNNTHIIDARSARIVTDYEQPMITLVTCFPFDSITTGGPLRFVVIATQVDQPIEGILV